MSDHEDRDAASARASLERAERMDAIKASLEDMKADRVSPAEEMLDEMRRILDEKKRR